MTTIGCQKFELTIFLQALEGDVSALTTRCSQLDAAELAARAAHDQILQDKTQVTAFLRER